MISLLVHCCVSQKTFKLHFLSVFLQVLFCDIDHCPVAADVTERLYVGSGAAQKLVLERCSFKKLIELEVSALNVDRFACFENLIIVGPSKTM
jgi:hypothetical protein